MARHIGSIAADDRSARQREIADRIQRLMPHEFIGEAQPFRIENPFAVERDAIVERRTQRKTHFPQAFDVAEETERARLGDLAAKTDWIEMEGASLAADCCR